MLKEAIQYLVSLKENKTYEINGDTYSDQQLNRIALHIDRPKAIQVNGLDSIVKLLQAEKDFLNQPIFVRIATPRKIEVLCALDSVMGRDFPYEAVCDAPDFKGGWRDHDTAIIELRSAFVPNSGTEYLLDLLSRISMDESVTSDDNGVSQTVSARKGVSLKSYEAVRPRIPLKPFRTFTEVEQPESEFILRVDDGGKVAFFEADGGKWKMDAKASIKEYLENALKAEVESGQVIVTM